MMGNPDAGRYVSRSYLREQARLWFLAGVLCALVAVAAGAFFFYLRG